MAHIAAESGCDVSAACKNRPGGSWRQCIREATGGDGYCNVCRSAISRGAKFSAEAEQRRRDVVESRNRAYREERLIIATAKRVRDRFPEVWEACRVEAADTTRGAS